MSSDDLKRTPLNAWHHAHGGRMVEFGGWDMPIQYETGIVQEHLATRRYVGLFDVSHMGRFRLGGADLVPFLQRVLSNNAEALEEWQAQYTLIPNEQGGLYDDAYLYRLGGDDYLLVVNASNREKDWAHLEKHAAEFDDVQMEDQTHELAMFAFQGPLAGQILEDLVEGDLPEPMRNRVAPTRLCGADIYLARTGYTGEPVAFEMFVPAEKAEEVWIGLLDAGGPQGALPVGLGARDTLRLEAGLPLYGHEFGIDADGEEIPAYAFPLTRIAVSFSDRKGDYVGREALAAQFEQAKRIRTGDIEPGESTIRQILPLALVDRGVVREGAEVFDGEEKIGVVTSGTVAPYWVFEGEGVRATPTDETDRRSVALAYLDAHYQPGDRVEVEVRGRRLGAEIVEYHGRSEAPPYFRPMPVGWEKWRPDTAAGRALEKATLLLERGVENHNWRQSRCFNLIPSEMTPSPLVRMLQVSDPVGRYAEHNALKAAFEQEVFYYQGTDLIGWVEENLKEEMADFMGCPLVEVRPLSGQMANMTVFSAFVHYKNRADRRPEPERIRRAMTNHIGKGGHLSAQPMGALRDYIAKDPVTERYAVVNFPVRKDNPYKIDVEATGDLLDAFEPEIAILGKSMILHPEPVEAIRGLIEERGLSTLVMYDMAHVLGLIGPHFQQPFAEGADIVTGSTHKTFFGTQRGVVGGNFEEDTPEYDLWKSIQRRAFPGMVSNHHLGTLLGQLLAALEMNAFKDDYQRQVIRNAKAFARALHHAGVQVEGDPAVDFTETHQVVVRVGYAEGPEVARHLEENNIICNYQALPDDESFTASSGLRLGVQEMTRFGMKEADFAPLAGLFADAVLNRAEVGDEVAALREPFRTMGYCFDEADVGPLAEALRQTF